MPEEGGRAIRHTLEIIVVQVPSLCHGHVVGTLDLGSELLARVAEAHSVKMDALLLVNVNSDEVNEGTGPGLVGNTCRAKRCQCLVPYHAFI